MRHALRLFTSKKGSAKAAAFSTIVVGGCVLSFALGADRAKRVRPPEKPVGVEPVILEPGEPTRLSAVLSEDGYWSIAGVVGLTHDANGRIIIEAKKDGDFQRDMVLSVPVRLAELDTGEVVPLGIERMFVGTDALVLQLEDTTDGEVAANECVYSPSQHRCSS